jgi:hypothetical protein
VSVVFVLEINKTVAFGLVCISVLDYPNSNHLANAFKYIFQHFLSRFIRNVANEHGAVPIATGRTKRILFDVRRCQLDAENSSI